MKSRFLERMDLLVISAHDPFERACLSLEKASYLARRGDYVESADIVRELRRDGQHLKNARVSAWLNFVEGMQLHVAGDDQGAKGKWLRSIALAGSIQAADVLARTYSWLAFVDYNSQNIESLKKNLNTSVSLMSEADFEASARTDLTLAQLFHLCGDFQKARRYYNNCRLTCLKSNDDVMLAALIHNMAWLRVAVFRNEQLQGFVVTSDDYIVELAAESTKNYESLIASKALDVMTPLLGAQVDVLLGRFERAERIITERLKDLRAQGLSRLTACLTSDRAYCRAQRGDFDGAKSDVKTALNAISEEDHIDDLAVLHSRIANVYRLSQDLDKALEFEAKSTNLWEKFRDHQREILGGIDGIRQSDC